MIFQFFGLQVKDVQLSAKEGNVCPLSRTFYCTSGGWSWLAGTQVILILDLLYAPSFLLEVTFLKLSDSFCLSVPLFAFLSVCVSLSRLPTRLLLPLPPSLFWGPLILQRLTGFRRSQGHYWGLTVQTRKSIPLEEVWHVQHRGLGVA